ncbi:MAG: TIM barrel protein [Candidatus Micrarchaeota archaeon]
MAGFGGLVFGSSGIPASAEHRNTAGGIRQTAKLGLGAMELAFVHGVNISEAGSHDVRKTAEEEKIILTCHAPYYINLNSGGSKLAASQKRLYDSARILAMAGGWSAAFHPGFYMGMEKQAVYSRAREGLAQVRKRLEDEGNTVWLRPETMGKGSQFGSLDEIIRLSQDVEGVQPLVDWGHMQARDNGTTNGREAFDGVLAKIEQGLGRESLRNVHFQVAGNEFTDKGERRHLTLMDGTLKYRELVESWKAFSCAGVVISESPNQELDALLLQKLWRG